MKTEIIYETIDGYLIAAYLKDGILSDLEIDDPNQPFRVGDVIEITPQRIDSSQKACFAKAENDDSEVILYETNLSLGQKINAQIIQLRGKDKCPVAKPSNKKLSNGMNALERLSNQYSENKNIHTEPEILEHRDILSQMEKLLETHISLSTGGEIVIEQTEALTSIDVNTGSGSGAMKTNLKAAKESIRQIRLRKIAGIILIDFIRMKNQTNREQILNKCKSLFQKDPIRTDIHGFTKSGLFEITRMHQELSLKETLSRFFSR